MNFGPAKVKQTKLEIFVDACKCELTYFRRGNHLMISDLVLDDNALSINLLSGLAI